MIQPHSRRQTMRVDALVETSVVFVSARYAHGIITSLRYSIMEIGFIVFIMSTRHSIVP